MSDAALRLFEGFGIEIEVMVVDARTLDVRPDVDRLLRGAAGADRWVEDHDDGPIGWSNELVAHVMELKTNGPVPSFDGLADAFLASTLRAQSILSGLGARLLPSAMHPWMVPARETVLWPHDNGPIYREYDRLFDCKRHGWANVQSVHLNLPFGDAAEFARLMAASRMVLPLIPALAASSPFAEGRATGLLDTRLEHYATNSTKVRAMTADVIPEPIFEIDSYRAQVFDWIDAELEDLGADPVLLGQEWTNARGAIARFDRSAIEIRLIDSQECALADVAVAAVVAQVVRGLVEERWCSSARQRTWATADLAALLTGAIRRGPDTPIRLPGFSEVFGVESGDAPTLGALWVHLAESCSVLPAELGAAIERILGAGTLAQRILRAAGPEPDPERLGSVYRELGDCLVEGRMFDS